MPRRKHTAWAIELTSRLAVSTRSGWDLKAVHMSLENDIRLFAYLEAWPQVRTILLQWLYIWLGKSFRLCCAQVVPPTSLDLVLLLKTFAHNLPLETYQRKFRTQGWLSMNSPIYLPLRPYQLISALCGYFISHLFLLAIKCFLQSPWNSHTSCRILPGFFCTTYLVPPPVEVLLRSCSGQASL
jgi:hypothetical protein